MGDKTPYRIPQQRLSGVQISPTQEVAATAERKIKVCKENLIFLASSIERAVHIYFTYEVMNLLKYSKLVPEMSFELQSVMFKMHPPFSSKSAIYHAPPG
jgi:hypothetical protein